MKISGTRSGALLALLTLCCLGIVRMAEGSVLQSLLYIPGEKPDCTKECRGLHRSYWPHCCESHNTCCQEFVNDCVEDCRPRVAVGVAGDLTVAEERPGMCCYMYNLCCTREVFRINPIVRGPEEPVKLPIVHRFSGGSADFHANSGKRLSVEQEQELREKQEIEEAKRKLLNRRGNPPSRNVASRPNLPEGVQRVPNLRLGGVTHKRVNLPAKQQPERQQEEEPPRPRTNPRRVVIRNRQKPREREEPPRSTPEAAPARQGIASNRQTPRENVRRDQENVGERRANINTIPNDEYTAQQENVQENVDLVREATVLVPETTYVEEDVPRQNQPPVREYVEIRRGGSATDEGGDTPRQNVDVAPDSARTETVGDPGQGSANVIQDEGQVR